MTPFARACRTRRMSCNGATRASGRSAARSSPSADGPMAMNFAVSFKCSKTSFAILSELPGLRPAPYLASRGLLWMQRVDDGALDDAGLRGLSAAKLRARRRRLAEANAARPWVDRRNMTIESNRDAFRHSFRSCANPRTHSSHAAPRDCLANRRRAAAVAEARMPAGDRFVQGARRLPQPSRPGRQPRPAAPRLRAAITAPPSLTPLRKLGIRARVFVPEIASPAKIAKIKAYGAEAMIGGAAYAEAQERCDAYVAESGALLIHPYDAVETIAGQGTVALEWEEDLERLGLQEARHGPGRGGRAAGLSPAWPPGFKAGSRSSASSRKVRARFTLRWRRTSRST